MANYIKSITQLIGGTPLVQLAKISAEAGINRPLLAKVEYFNPGGSVKDRIALAMIDDAERQGLIRPGDTIIEPTSGNTGVGLALVSAVRGYHLILTMPETMSVERQKLARAYGADIRLTPGAEGMAGAVNAAKRLNEEIPGSIILGQFTNPANPACHYRTTALELWQQTEGDIDIIVGGVGTGGTISGTARKLKELKPTVQAVAVEPATSPLLSQGTAGKHKIQGIGANFVPDTLDRSVVDQIVTITNDEAYEAARNVARQEGLLVGISSGAALAAAIKTAKANPNKQVVVVLPDTGERYLSTDLF